MSTETNNISCKLVHHGAAASSSPHCLVWLPPSSAANDSQIVYTSHGIVNICKKRTVLFGNEKESIWSVDQTLRTSMPCAEAGKRVITTLAHVGESLVCGFSNGSVTMWTLREEGEWKEQPILTTDAGPSITHLDGHYFENNGTFIFFTCSCQGTSMISMKQEGEEPTITTTPVASFAANVVNCQVMPFDQVLVLIGTAAPRHNKIHLYTLDSTNHKVHHLGSLTGHEDWITTFAWNSTQTILASGSQDHKIRLWQFTTTTTQDAGEINNTNMAIVSNDDEDDNSDDDDDIDDNDDLLDEEGEARLEWVHDEGITRVTLEALLFGHEEAVTALCWHPNPLELYRQEEILISSSMDRTLLIWSPVTGVWTPLTRVGGAGGILGGSIGSTLLGYVDVLVEPESGTSLIGHAYGGALHVWNLEQDVDIKDMEEVSLEDIAMHNKWKAMPCITGHFEGVTDLCWEAERGDYLLTVSADQTCRLWAPVTTEENKEELWVELARPQVHGYDLAAVASVSTADHGHLYVSGADEKEARVFDAPMSTLRLLRAAYGKESKSENGTPRVERAYIPSLGLSQKASAADGAEMDTTESDVATTKEESHVRLPLERDLGVVSLWPEVRKLFGHNTELFCLASTVSARSGPKFSSSPFASNVLVASSTKARDVDSAAIRVWNVERRKCVQVLSGGHRSTVAALCFSPDGRYLASSGKDRRLCLWSRTDEGAEPSFSLASAVDSAHRRIVWGLHFCPFEPSLLASGSRDGRVKLWKVSNAGDAGTSGGASPELTEVSSFEPSSKKGSKSESVTSLSFAPRSYAGDKNTAILALGLECGFVEVWAVPTSDFDTKECQMLLFLPPAYSHISTVSKIAWRPLCEGEEDDDKLTLASCSLDRGCRVFEMEF